MINQENKVYGYLGLTMKAGKLSFGTDSVIETIEKHKAKVVLIAKDCSERTLKNFREITKKHNVTLIEFGTIEKISNSIGKSNKAVIAVKDSNLANEIKKIINGGDTIG